MYINLTTSLFIAVLFVVTKFWQQHKHPSKKRQVWARSMTQVVEHLLSKHKTLSSNPTTGKTKGGTG
jgi:hypothetical protein